MTKGNRKGCTVRDKKSHIESCIDGDKLIIKRPDGKEVKAKITRRARLRI
jgi:hypothetical protein